jgi:hypothetical protein
MTSWPVHRATHQPLRRHDFTAVDYATRPHAWRKGALARSVPVRQALLVAFEIALGLLWVGVTVSIVQELVGWWAALEYAELTTATPWTPW